MKLLGKSVARSFDLFDTLIARRCKDPLTVFKIIEARSGVCGFAAARKEAERRAQSGAEYTIDTIYKELPDLLHISEDSADGLKALEISIEIEQVIPIAENIRLVRDGDIVVSDMYLPVDVLRQMLLKAGLRKDVEIFVSARGKMTGAIWSRIRHRYHIVSHVGDNVHSDFRSPVRRAIPARLTKASGFSETEGMLFDMGVPALALVARQARLSLWHDDWLMRRLQSLQADLNLPLLLLASFRLLEVVEEVGAARVLFCARDGNLWISLFRKMTQVLGVEIEAEYFYTSRPARLNCSQNYQTYCRARLDGRALVVDIGGTGWSLSSLADTLGLSSVNCFFIHHIPQLASYERLKPMKDNVRVYSLFSTEEKSLYNAVLEMCNYADHASVLDVELRDGQVMPLWMPETRNADELRAVVVQREAFLQSIEAVGEPVLRSLKETAPAMRKDACTAIYRRIMDERALSFMFQKVHSEEDKATLAGMGAASKVERDSTTINVAVARFKRRIRRLQLRVGL